MASFDTSKIVSDIKAGKITSKEPPKYIFVKNPRNNRKVKKLNPRWTAWSKKQKGKEIDKKVDTYVKKMKGDKPIRKVDYPSKTVEKPKNVSNEKNKKDNQNNKEKVVTPKYKEVTQAELDKKISENKKGKEPLKVKPKKMPAIEKRNRKRFGDAHVDKLKARYAEFKAKRKKKKKV